MVGLSTSLRSLVDSLSVQQTTLSYLSDNISNVNTEGYVRKEVTQETKISNGVVIGVGVAEIRRAVDDFLANAVREQTSELGQAEVKNDFYDRIQEFVFGDPDSDFTINNSLNSFFNRLELFSNDPSSNVNASLVVTAAEEFTAVIADISLGLQNERFNADTEIDNVVGQLNSIFANLNDINAAIQQNSVSGGDVGRLLDARDSEILNIKEIIDADYTFDEFGRVSVSIASTEFVGFTQQYEVQFSRVNSVDSLINGSALGSITVTALDESGNLTGNVETLLSASNATEQIDRIPNGKLRGLIDLRDSEIPEVLNQIDTLAFTFANSFNEIHNSGSGFPPREELLGTQQVTLTDEFNFTGQVRIAILDENGRPVEGRFSTDLLPLVIDLDEFNGANGGFGTGTVGSLINEINAYYGIQPNNIANLGGASDIRIASSTDDLGLAAATGRVSFATNPTDGETIVINGSTVTFADTPAGALDVQIGASLLDTLQNLNSFLNITTDANISVATYSYENGSTFIDVKADIAGANVTNSGNNFTLGAGTAPVTISGATLTGGTDASGIFNFDLELTNVDSLGRALSVDVASYAVNAGAAQAITFNTSQIQAGERKRTDRVSTVNDSIGINITSLGLQEGDSFDITLDVAITDSDGNIYNEDITYTVALPDPDGTDLRNLRFTPSSISGTQDGELVDATSNTSFLTASFVDADGNSVSDDTTAGFLRLNTRNSTYRISIDQLDSNFEDTTIGSATEFTDINKGFSHFFGLNNFFEFGGELNNSSINFSINSDITATPSFMTRGKVQQSIGVGSNNVYTYELGAGTNTTLIDLVSLQEENILFSNAGSLPQISTTIGSYSTEFYNFSALLANSAESEFDKQTLLAEALNRKFDDISGVNVDEELAQTIQVQNSYAASAKIISVVQELFAKLEESLL